MPTKRIEYIDALRGFCMYLVVYAHVCGYGYHMNSEHSFHHILVNFYLVLFFFVSGFVAYKKDVEWTGQTIGKMLRKKFVQLIIPSVVFCFLFCIYDHHSYNPLWHVSTSWYWFTNNPNPAIEFFITTAIALMVIAISIVIGNIIRLSPTLSHYLLGTK